MRLITNHQLEAASPKNSFQKGQDWEVQVVNCLLVHLLEVQEKLTMQLKSLRRRWQRVIIRIRIGERIGLLIDQYQNHR